MTTRRLAAILAADVVGFSSMMEKDEEGTASRIRAVRREVIEPRLSAHQGSVGQNHGGRLSCRVRQSCGGGPLCA